MSEGLSVIERDDISIVLCGQAGQGIQTVELLLTRILKLAGYNVFATKEYMSRVRGGQNSTEIRVSGKRVKAFVDRIDILVAFNDGAIEHLGSRISRDTIVYGDKSILGENLEEPKFRFSEMSFSEMAEEIGDKIYSNSVAVGMLAGLFTVPWELVAGYVRKYFSPKSQEVIEKNIRAAEVGHGISLPSSDVIKIPTDETLASELFLNGAEAVALGAIAGGCNFVSSYPMSPSTGVLVFMAQHGRDFGIIVEQAEDEIAAMNMAIGAWYAGARGMVTTSGGGFALMTEGVSLAGMLESPMVIHLAQRPGPATGLPTRTEQGDLELALYSGHGEFPRIILSPGTIEQAFYLTQRAFNLADKYQVPVFVMTDEYLMDSYYNTVEMDLSDVKVARHIVKTTADYRRYELTENGISPRGVPGYGEGLVAVDSDEHDEDGHITEDLDLRVRMVDKRLGKAELIKEDIIKPELVGPEDYKNLVVCWGSTYHIVKEAMAKLGRDDSAMLHYKQVYPVAAETADYLKRAERIIMVEGNATGQFGKLIKLGTGIEVDERILKYSGLNFTVEEVEEKLRTLLG